MPVDEDYFESPFEKDCIRIILSYIRKWLKIDALLLKEELMSEQNYTVSEIIDYMAWAHDKHASLWLLPTYFYFIRNKAIKRHTEKIQRECIANSLSAEEMWEKLKYIEKFYMDVDKTSEDYIDMFLADIEDRKEKKFALETWFRRLDNMVWLEKGWLFTIGARSSMGKSTYALNIWAALAKKNRNVVVFSIEMKEIEYIQRLAALETWVNLWVFKNGNAPQSIIAEFVDKYKEMWKYIKIKEWSFSAEEIIRYIESHPGIDVVIIDYLQLLRWIDWTKSETKSAIIGKITARLKQVAQENNVLIIQISQITRWSDRVEKESCPRLESLKDSWSIEQDSDVVVILHRDSREDTDWIIRIAKNRHWEIWDIQWTFNFKTMRINEK